MSGLNALPGPLVEDIALKKAQAESMRLEFRASDGNACRKVVLERSMTSPVCTVSRERLGSGHPDFDLALQTAYVRARLPVVLDVLHVALSESFFFEQANPSSQFECPQYSVSLQLGGQHWGHGTLQQQDFEFDGDVDDEEQWTAARRAWAQGRSDAALSHPVIARLLRIFCENSAL